LSMADEDKLAKANEKIAKLVDACEGLLEENEMLHAKVKKYENLLEAISDERGLLGVLQKMAHDPRLPVDTRIKAAAAALPYERPKLSVTATANIGFLAARLDQAQPPKIIEHDSKPAA
jgi:hypothetical protein